MPLTASSMRAAFRPLATVLFTAPLPAQAAETLPAQAAETASVDYPLAALVLLLTALIVSLLMQNQRHRRDKARIRQHYAEITHAARLALIGEITASITHEVTQPLSAILSNVETAELLLRQPEPDLACVREILADVRKDDLRAHGIVKRLRTLLRKRDVRFEEVDVNMLVSNVLDLIKPDAGRREVTVSASLDPELPRVSADPVHLQQVVLNLLVNALEAVKQTPAGARQVHVRTGRRSGGFAEIAVLDNGHGIASEHAGKVFDPFFTTQREGMGLGLSIARSIVQMHGGALRAENRDDGGAVFRFTVPLMSEGDAAAGGAQSRTFWRPQY